MDGWIDGVKDMEGKTGGWVMYWGWGGEKEKEREIEKKQILILNLILKIKGT